MNLFGHALLTLAEQLIGLFGVIVLCALTLSWLQRLAHRQYVQTWGWRSLYFTAWLGTPVHELGHYFFAKLFRHRVHKVALFSPHSETGLLGQVTHSFERSSLYQRFGNLFVGAAPLIFGPLVIIVLLAFLAPGGREALQILGTYRGDLTTLWPIISSALTTLWLEAHWYMWQFWVFKYAALSIAVHSAPSRQDLRSVFSGLLVLAVTLLVTNALAAMFGKNLDGILAPIEHALAVAAIILFLLVALAALHVIIVWILFAPFKKIFPRYGA